MKYEVFIGFDSRQVDAFAVACHSIRKSASRPIDVRGIVLRDLERAGSYTRPYRVHGGLMMDKISDAPMSTEFAISRFFTPLLAKASWALFCDSDVMVRCDIHELFALADPTKAIMCVHHVHEPTAWEEKMLGQRQIPYARKNWSSVVLYNCSHPSNRGLTLETLNRRPGRDLHRFCWLRDDEIGELGPEWNYLIGVTPKLENPKIVHFTQGTPSMQGYELCEYADEWRSMLGDWAGSPL